MTGHVTEQSIASSSDVEFLSQDECRALLARVLTMCTGNGDVSLSISSRWTSHASWARNRMHVVGISRDNTVDITRNIRGAQALASTTRIDDDGLRQLVKASELSAWYTVEQMTLIVDPLVVHPIVHPTLWSDATYRWDAAARTATARAMMAPAEAAGMVAAGNLLTSARGQAVVSSQGLLRYYPVTEVECSMTVRDTKGSASGWAGVSHYDHTKVNPEEIAARALEKCQRSVNPVAFEPGRYTTILEPQAVADFFTPLIEHMMGRLAAEEGSGPFRYRTNQSKIGQKVLDSRLSVRADPMDPDAGYIPFDENDGTPYRAVTWIDRGILKELAYDREYALYKLHADWALPNSKSYTLTPAAGVQTTTIDDMIAATERGILVTRFSGVTIVDDRSMLSTGYTRDGVWLVERGKISKAIKNFRFTESPLFAFNNLEHVGVPVRVFRPGFATLAPAMRVRDFSFTSLIDAV